MSLISFSRFPVWTFFSFVSFFLFFFSSNFFVPVRGFDGLIVNTPLGPIEGEILPNLNVRQFTNIPFALPPVGNLRWASPVPVTQPWSSPYQAIRNAPQFVGRTVGLCLQFFNRTNLYGDEDCLYLNVSVPTAPTSNNLPVVVYIYGGGFEDTDVENLSYLVNRTQAVIYVQIAYRVNVFGFYAHPGLSAERYPRESSGGYGFEDQQLALRWVQANIASFGGNPNDVTLQGFSAGAISVCVHLVAPASRDLFHKVIMESGGCDTDVYTLEAQEALGVELANADPHCPNLAAAAQVSCLRNLAASELVFLAGKLGLLSFFGTAIHPFVDGLVVTESPYDSFKRGAFMNVPVLAGTSALEMLAFVESPAYWPDPTWGNLTAYNIANNIRSYAPGSPSFQAAAVDFFTQIAPVFSPQLADPAIQFAFILSGYIFQCSQRRILSAMATIGKQTNIWMYNWNFNSPSLPILKGIPVHGSQTAFFYNTPGNYLTPYFATDEQTYANIVQTLIFRFIYNNNPNIPSNVTDQVLNAPLDNVPVWPNYQAEAKDPATGAATGDLYYSFNGVYATGFPSFTNSITIAPRPHEQACGIWDQAIVNALPQVVPRYQACPGGLIADPSGTTCIQPYVAPVLIASVPNGVGQAAVVRTGYTALIASLLAISALLL